MNLNGNKTSYVLEEYPEHQTFNSSELGLELIILPTGELVDISSDDAVLIDLNYLAECEQNIVDWMDDSNVNSADDFKGEAESDWKWIVQHVRKNA